MIDSAVLLLTVVASALANHVVLYSVAKCDKRTGKPTRTTAVYSVPCGVCVPDDGGLMFSCTDTTSADYFTKDKGCDDQSRKREIDLVDPKCIPVNPNNLDDDYIIIRTYTFASEHEHHSAAKRSAGRLSKLDLAKMMLGLI